MPVKRRFYEIVLFWIFSQKDDLTVEELARLDESYDKLFASKHTVVGYLEGHELQDDDNFSRKMFNDNIEL